MAISIVGYADKDKSKLKSETEAVIVFVLSEAPGKPWRLIYADEEKKNRPLKITTSFDGKNLTVTAPGWRPAQIRDEVQRLLDATNKADEAFKKELSELKFP